MYMHMHIISITVGGTDGELPMYMRWHADLLIHKTYTYVNMML